MRAVALITGAGSGIGKALALELASKNFDLVLLGRRQHLLENTLAEASSKWNAHGWIFPCDLSSPAATKICVEQILGTLLAEQRTVSLLVHNAGLLCGGALQEISEGDLRAAFEVNLMAPVLLAKAFQGDLVRSKGKMVYIASNVAHTPLPYASAYSASKAGLQGFALSHQFELRRLGVGTLIVYPPATESPMTSGRAQAAGLPSFALMRPEALARKIVGALQAGKMELKFLGSERFFGILFHLCPGLVRLLLGYSAERFKSMMSVSPSGSEQGRIE